MFVCRGEGDREKGGREFVGEMGDRSTNALGANPKFVQKGV